MRSTIVSLAVCAAFALSAGAASSATQTPAKVLFSKATVPSSGQPRPIGSYARGCMAGAQSLPIDGPHWQVMRLSRNRNWGMPELIDYIEKLSADAVKVGWNGLLIGDMAQPRGGPMITGHASHQVGLDADIWFTQMPDHVMNRDEREKKAAASLLKSGVRLTLDQSRWSDLYARLLKQAVSYPEVARIFVSPAIKKELCETVPDPDHAWLRKLRPWYGHDDHFHVRLQCPPGIAGCADQAAPPPGDGCGADLAYWFRPPPPPPKKPVKPRPPPPELTLADLPKACAAVLSEGAAGVSVNAGVPVPKARPETN